MLQTSIRKGFTLIELLVVITIIGILATGAVTVYTSQIQKARDTTRIKDVDALKVSAEQVYQDSAEYPHGDTFVYGDTKTTWMNTYMKQLPSDAKHGQTCSNDGATTVDCGYAYKSEADSNGIEHWAYEISTGFESEGNVTKKAAGDVWDDDLRYETGLELNTIITKVAAGAITGTQKWVCKLAWWVAGAKELVVIDGNPTSTTASCG